MMGWISISDEFPKNPRQVIVRFIKPVLGVPRDSYEMGFFEDPEKCKIGDSCGWLYWSDNKPITYPVTHWMPLPEPPKD